MVLIIGGIMFHSDKRIIECRECPYGKPVPYKCKYGGHQGFLFTCTNSTPDYDYCAAARWACGIKTIPL
jgi:hypothetical protein